MIFIIREAAGRVPALDIKMVRQAPSMENIGKIDFFCLGDPEAARAAGWTVMPVHDGWYADDATGGMAIWEVRDTHFTVKQSCGPEAWPTAAPPDHDAVVNVRQAIFRG